MNPPPITIRTMTTADLERAVEWAAREGWNPGLADAAAFRAADPDGFLMAFLDEEPVASISVVRYGEKFGFLGFYIVPPEFRGRGIGLALWQAGMARLRGMTVGLDGVVAQQENYVRSGFVLAHRQIRFGGAVAATMPEDPRLKTITPETMPATIGYDGGIFLAPRENFLRAWTALDRHVGIAIVEDGRLSGYGVVRPCRSGHKIGPLFAGDEARADLLFRALVARAGGGEIFLDVPEPNRAGLALAARYGLKPAFETARMYRGSAPALPLERIFGVTTFELG